MGKAARLKGLRQIANTLPVIMRHTQEVHYVKGAELIEQGHDRELITPEKMYKQKMPVMIAINHQRNMKKLFNQYGINGVKAYILAANKHQIHG